MNYVWTIYYETNISEEVDGKMTHGSSFIRVLDSFEKAKEEYRKILKALGEKKNEFFDGEGHLKYLDKWVERDMDPDGFKFKAWYKNYAELYRKTAEIMTSMFKGEEVSTQCLSLIKNKVENEEGASYLGFKRDYYGSEWFTDTDRIAKCEGKVDGMFDVDYITTECDTQEEGYLFMKANAFLLEDPDRDYYCYVRVTDWAVRDGYYFHIDLQKHEVE